MANNILGDNMKIITILFVLIPVLTAFPQEIASSRTTMEISNTSSQIDSITFYNNGANSLIIDSIQCAELNFQLSIGQFSDSANWVPIEDYFNATNVIEIQPADSFQVQISFLAVICKLNQNNYPQVDTIYFYNNSTNMPIFPIEITHTMTKILERDKIVSNYILHQNYPNPFNPETTIEYFIAEPGKTSIIIFNILGEIIELFDEGFQTIGRHYIIFNGRKYPSGVYYYKIKSGNFSEIRSMVLLK
jgi:hypothetical protein